MSYVKNGLLALAATIAVGVGVGIGYRSAHSVEITPLQSRRIAPVESVPDDARYGPEMASGIPLGFQGRYENGEASIVVTVGRREGDVNIPYAIGFASNVPMPKSQFDRIEDLIAGEMTDGDEERIRMLGNHIYGIEENLEYARIMCTSLSGIIVDDQFIDLTPSGENVEEVFLSPIQW